jgi:hypothetical protein
MPCCSSPGPAYKQRVDLVFSSSGSTAQTAALSANIDAGAVTKLLYYANVNTDKLPQIARELERRIAKELAKKRFALAVCGAFALNELLKSCHRDLRLFYPHVAATIKSLLACVPSREIQLVGVDLFATFAALPTRVLPPPSDADAFVREFVRMASSNPETSSSPSSNVSSSSASSASAASASTAPAGTLPDLPAPFTATTARHARVAGLRGIRAYFPLLDELPSRLNDDALRILPSIFDNFRLTGPAASGPVPRTPLSPEHSDANNDDDDDDAAAAAKKKAAGDADRADDADVDSAADPDDPDASPSVRALARQCLRELVVRTSTTNVKSLVEAALEYVDSNGLWSVDAGGEFPRELFATICGTLKPHDYQTALDSLLAKVTSVPDTAHKTRVVETLRHCLRSGMLTVHQLVRTLLQQLVDSLKAAFGAKDASHAELNRSLIACVVELGRVVEQPKRLDTLNGIVRQIKALEGVFSKASQRSAGNALLVRAFAGVAAHLKPLGAADSVQLASAYDALLVVAAAPASGDERVACALATIDALRALVAAAPPRTEDDDDRDGHRFATTSGGAGGAGGGGATSGTAGSTAGGVGAAGGSSGTGSAVDGAVGAAADIKKRAARARRGTGGPRDLGLHAGASTFVENHAHVLSALDTFLFPDEATGTAALSALVAAGGSLLLSALSVYGVGEALRTLPFIFSLQQRALDLPDSAPAAATKKSRKANVAAAVGLDVVPQIADPSAVHVLVGTYMTALAEQLDSDELRATVTHTQSQRAKKKQRSVYVAANAACVELVFSEKDASKKALLAAKRITLTFERAGVVSVLTREKQLQQFEVLAARLALEWERTGAVAGKFPASARLNRLGSVHTVASTRGALHATESDRDVRGGGAIGSDATRGALASYPHNAPPAPEPSAKQLADANIDVNAFLAVLRGDAVVGDDDAVLGNASGDDDHSLHRSGAPDDENDDDDAMMQVSDSEARSEISIDDDDDAAAAAVAKGKKSKKDAKKGAKDKKAAKAKAKKRRGAKQRASTTSNDKQAPAAAGTEQWRAQVARLRERSFEEVSAVSARAQERAVRETALAAFGFDSEAFVDDDELGEPLPAHHNWHVATTLPSLLQKLDAEFDGAALPHLRDDFACGALVVR